MPELPEVETIARGLRERIVGEKIIDVRILEPKTAQFEAAELSQFILNKKVKAIRRRGKVLMWDLDSEYTLLFHLKMTGQVVFDSNQTSKKRYAGGHPTKSMASDLPDDSTRLIFILKTARIYFNDQRKFGWVKLVPTARVHEEDFLNRMGPEPLDGAKVEDLYAKTKTRTAPIKAVILDQSVIAGVGNIYADESLHMARIHPATSASNLSKKQIESLFVAIQKVLKQSIQSGGTSFTNYVNVLGTKGDYLQNARVFKRQGETCQVCGDIIIKTRVAGRGTHVCPTCQPKLKGWQK